MAHQLAQVIVTAPSDHRQSQLTALLDAKQFALITVPGNEVRKKAREGRPDLIIIDVGENPDLGIDLCTEFNNHPETESVPKVLVGDAKTSLPVSITADLGADDLIVDVDDVKAMTARLMPLLRLSTMKAELRRRLISASGFGLLLDPDQDLDVDDDPYSVLIAAAEPGPAKALLTEGLDGHCRIQTVSDPFDVENTLGEKRFDACFIIEDATLFSEPNLLELSNRIRQNPGLFNLPVMAATQSDCDHRHYYQKGISRVMSLGSSPEDFAAVLTLLVNRQRLRWRIRQAMDEALDPFTLEPSGAFHMEFFRAHLDRMIADAHEGHKPLAVIGFDFPTVQEIREDVNEQAANHLVRQLAQWINSMTRVEDVVCQASESRFYVALPDTPREDADFVMHRVAGVLSRTDFALFDVYRPVTVSTRYGLTLLEPDDKPATLIERADQVIK